MLSYGARQDNHPTLVQAAARAAAKVANSCSKPVWPGEEEEEHFYNSASQDTGSVRCCPMIVRSHQHLFMVPTTAIKLAAGVQGVGSPRGGGLCSFTAS